MNHSQDPFVDGDPEEIKEPLLEIPKTKSTQRKTLCGLYGIEEGKIHTLPGFRLRREFHRDQSTDGIHTEKVNTRPCRFGSQKKVNTTWSGKVEIYTAPGGKRPVAFGFGTACRRVLECP